MGKLKGTKAAMLRQMGERGELGPRLPAKVERKTPVKATPELLREACDRFAAGETLTAICLDEHMPTRQSLYLFSLTDPRHEEMWATAKALHAERLMEDIIDIADGAGTVKGPDGRVDSGQVQRDRLRVEVRQMRAIGLDPSRWGRKTEQTIKGDADNPLVVKEEITMEKRVELFLAFQARTERPREPSGFGRPEPKAIEHQAKPSMTDEQWSDYVKRIGGGQ
jgi:hypothetical protein